MRTQDQQPKAILSTIPEWTSAQRTKNASRTGQDQLNITHKVVIQVAQISGMVAQKL